MGDVPCFYCVNAVYEWMNSVNVLRLNLHLEVEMKDFKGFCNKETFPQCDKIRRYSFLTPTANYGLLHR